MALEMVSKRPLLQDEEGRSFYSTDDDEEEVELFTQAPNNNQHSSKSKATITLHVKMLTIFVSLGQFLFGYDTGVVSGSMLFIRKQYGLSDVWQEAIVSATIVAAALFAFLGGPLGDRLGRRLTAVVAGLLFTLGSIVLGTANGPRVILGGRVLVGCGLGLTSMCLPMYLSECAPAKVRGRLLLMSCTFGCSGMLCANIVDGIFSYNQTNGWRYMLGIASIPAIIMAAGFLLMPESPRWLVKTGDIERARLVLAKVRSADEVESELAAIKKICDEDSVKKIEAGNFVLIRILRYGPTRRALMVGCGLQMFQQLAAINTVMYYTASIMKMSGIYDNHTAIWLSALVAGVNVLFTFVGMMLVDKIGRRKLILASYSGVIASLTLLAVGFLLATKYSPPIVKPHLLNNTCDQYEVCQRCIEDSGCGFCFNKTEWVSPNGYCFPILDEENAYVFSSLGECSNDAPSSSSQDDVWAYGFCPTKFYWIPVLGMMTYLIFFAPGLASVPWIVNTELYPIWARSTGTGLATATNWIFNFIVSMTFLNLVSLLGKPGVFVLYTSLSVVGMIFTAVFLPETKGKKLEELEQLFKRSTLKT